jgi:hypothetical protein
MSNKTLKQTDHIIVDESTRIPLYGLDFLGILDRGTNVLEVKPITICNLRCKYCFVSAGDYIQNFTADPAYLLKWLKKAIEIKQCNDIEIHLAPYGEILLYPSLFDLIREMRKIPQVKVISAQSNGLLLTPDNITQLAEVGLNRINISLNSMDPEQCAKFCGVLRYNLTHLLNMFDEVLKSKMDLLIAPVWFMGKNDQGIMDIVEYIKNKVKNGFNWPKLRLGIQNYLTYRTGRKLKNVYSREFQHFYHRLTDLERQSGLKLKLGPNDFDIHKTIAIAPPLEIDQEVQMEVLREGRWKNEYICLYDDSWGVKLLSNRVHKTGEKITVKITKSSLSGNLLTAIFP